METWPSFAKARVEGFDEAPDYGVLRTEMDGGLAKQRTKYSKPIVTRSVSFSCSLPEKELFRSFMEAADVTGWFNWTDPTSNIVKKARIFGGKVAWSAADGLRVIGKLQLETIG